MKLFKKNFYKHGRGSLRPIIAMDWKRRRVLEIQKNRCRSKISFHAQNVVLQALVSVLCVTGGMYAAQKRSIIVPLVAAPSAACSLSKLVVHETKRRRFKEILGDLERSYNEE